MIVIRRGILADVEREDFRELVRAGLYSTGIKRDAVDEEKLWEYCRYLRYGYGAVALEEERYVGYIGGTIAEHPFLCRRQLTVNALFSTSPGAGMKLLRECLKWAGKQLSIRHVFVAAPVDERLNRIIARKYSALRANSFLIEV